MSMKIAGLQNSPALCNKKLIGSVPAAPLLKSPCKVESQHIHIDVDDSACPGGTPLLSARKRHVDEQSLLSWSSDPHPGCHAEAA